ncbi:MAG: hypothetical protein GXO02_02480 [Epsilonproteobacteria bacterium]|nr:hypothetical protein [Campylobacterota bacterium]
MKRFLALLILCQSFIFAQSNFMVLFRKGVATIDPEVVVFEKAKNVKKSKTSQKLTKKCEKNKKNDIFYFSFSKDIL